MNELHRQAYLDAMGVDGYFPRAVLPGALPSPICLLEIKSEVASQLAEGGEGLNQGGSPSTASMAKDVLANTGLADLSKKPAKTKPSAPASQSKQEEAATQTEQPTDGTAVPHFSLTLINGSTYTLIAKGVDQSQQQAYQQMLANILFALGDQAQSQGETFNWPMINSAAVDQSLPVAKSACDAFVKDKSQQRTVIIFGEAANYLSLSSSNRATIEQCSNNGFKYTVVACAAAAFHNPALKRGVWDDLLAIRQIKA